ncbi:MAG: hypothetical protein ILP19_09080 [Oscillospiraceae bacterium]|nr:hypothetical protein [Oscillospiraceae bacterium]
MKKLMLVLLTALLCSCEAAKTDTSVSQSAASGGIRDKETLRREYPEYFELGAFKGIELYVWQDAPGSYRCGAMSGTNRNKTDEEIWALFPMGVSPEEMQVILSSYNADGLYDFDGEKTMDVLLYPVIQPASSYAYTIDDSYRETVKSLFHDTETPNGYTIRYY